MDPDDLQAFLDKLCMQFQDIAKPALRFEEFRPGWLEGDLYGSGFYYFKGRLDDQQAYIWIDRWRMWVHNPTRDPRIERVSRGRSLELRSEAEIFSTLLHEFAHHVDFVRNKRDPVADLAEDGQTHDDSWRSAYRVVVEMAKDVDPSSITATVIDLCRREIGDPFEEPWLTWMGFDLNGVRIH